MSLKGRPGMNLFSRQARNCWVGLATASKEVHKPEIKSYKD